MTVPKAVIEAKKFTLNPKVGMPIVAGALVNLCVGPLADLGLIDLTAYTADLTLVIMGVVGWLTPSN